MQSSTLAPTGLNADPHRRDAGHGHRSCVCSSDHCNGTPGNEYCRGTDGDGGAHGAAVDDGHAEHPDANCFTAYRLNLNCCGDPGDCQPDAACRTP